MSPKCRQLTQKSADLCRRQKGKLETFFTHFTSLIFSSFRDLDFAVSCRVLRLAQPMDISIDISLRNSSYLIGMNFFQSCFPDFGSFKNSKYSLSRNRL